MKARIKDLLRRVMGINNARFLGMSMARIRSYKSLAFNFWTDFRLYCKESTIFKKDSYRKIEALIILDYHRIEKGLLFESMKPRFAMVSIVALHVYLNKEMVIAAKSRTQIKVAYQLMCQYYDLHQRAGIYIGDYYTNEQYVFYKNILGEEYSNDFQGAIKYSFDSFYRFNEADFKCFSNSRKSIRNFTGEKVNEVLIRDAVQLAMNAPSVCNRQSAKVYLVEDKVKIDKILEIQGGFRGYTEQVGQLLILTTDRNYFYTIGERNQLYIDGGIFLMNLLYALHYYKIANCPANWGKTVQEEEVLSKYIFLPNSEKIICMVPIGVANPEFSVCLSRRRDIDEVFISL